MPSASLDVSDTLSGAVFAVRVTPRASRTEVTGVCDGTLLVRLAAAPVDGAANDALIELLAGLLRCPTRAIAIVGGARSRSKRVWIEGLDAEAVQAGLGARGVRSR
jgi:uncharacterized protein YggU (UPF0235/DUF167 family)